MIPPNAISQYYIVRSKIMKKALNPKTYDKLILRDQGEVNKQGNIVLMNIGVGFYETQLNFTKNTMNSKSISIRKFLYGHGNFLVIKLTSDTENRLCVTTVCYKVKTGIISK